MSDMSRVAVIGEQARVAGFTLAGAMVFPADTAAEMQAAWEGLPDSVVVVLLTASASACIGEARLAAGLRPTVVMPA